MKPWRDFIWLLVNALRKLPPVDPGDVFRGCKMAPSELNLELDVGFEFTWSAFSSTATKLATMQQFVGKSGPRTLLTLTLTEPVGRDVRDFSLYEFQIQIQKLNMRLSAGAALMMDAALMNGALTFVNQNG